MKFIITNVFIITVLFIILNSCYGSEPVCSKFHYEEQLLEKSIRTQIFVETMSKEMKTIQDEVKNTLQRFETNIRDELKNVIDERDSLKTQIETLKTESVQQISSASSKMENTFKIQEAQIARMAEDFRDMQNGTIERLKEMAVTPSIVFKARSVADTSPITNQVLVFATTMINEGAGYDKTTGIFTAPVDGVYLFTVQFCGLTTAFFYFAIVSDDNVITNAFVYEGSANSCHTADGVSVMKKGMRAFVKCTSGQGNALTQIPIAGILFREFFCINKMCQEINCVI